LFPTGIAGPRRTFIVQRTTSDHRHFLALASHWIGYPITAKGGYAMAIEAHIAELAEKHRVLDAAIEEELNHPFADSLRITEMKREKLRLKEVISKLEHAN
jgi:hypothetical protein